jgi:parvulin-like peptidyl-prolyl isomerase
MKKQIIIVILVAGLALLGLVGYQQGMLPVPPGSQGITSSTSVNTGTTQTGQGMAAQQNWAQSARTPIDTALGFEEVQQVLANVDTNQKKALLEDENAFQEFVRQEASQLSLLAAANSNKVDQDPNAKFLMQRSSDNVLREIYVNKLINSKIPAGFPSDEQINQYYENNKDNLVIEERVSVWQIFLPIAEGMTGDQVSELESRANRIANDIRDNRIDFTTAALDNSQHQPSKLNGGYMGILKVSELIPGIHEALMALEEGEVSSPVKSEMGFHILKRDRVIPSQGVTLDQVRGQIRNLLVNQMRAKLRNEIMTLASETYPVEVTEEMIAAWRARLRSEM